MESNRAGEWHSLSPSEIENRVDAGLRHKTGKTPTDYLAHWLQIARQFAFTTNDDSFGEFEKAFAIIIRRLVVAETDKLRLIAALEALVKDLEQRAQNYNGCLCAAREGGEQVLACGNGVITESRALLQQMKEGK